MTPSSASASSHRPAGAKTPVSGWVGWILAAALALAALWCGLQWQAAALHLDSLRLEAEHAQLILQDSQQHLEAERILARRQLEELRRLQAQLGSGNTQTAPDSRPATAPAADDFSDWTLTLLTPTEERSEARGIVLWNPQAQVGLLTLHKLLGFPASQAWQLWIRDSLQGRPILGGTFWVDPRTGGARLSIRPDQPIGVSPRFSVHKEAPDSPSAGAGPPVLSSP